MAEMKMVIILNGMFEVYTRMSRVQRFKRKKEKKKDILHRKRKPLLEQRIKLLFIDKKINADKKNFV